jgi:hypothetical protein
VTDPATLPVAPRLVNGARLLGQLWRSGERCANGWSGRCECQAKTKFCAAKAQWCQLKATTPDWRKFEDSAAPFAVIDTMTLNEIAATGLTVEYRLYENARTLKVGPKGEISVMDFAEICAASSVGESRAEAESVLRIMTTFSGAKVVGVEKTPAPKQETKKEEPSHAGPVQSQG